MCLYSIFELRITLKNGVDFLSELFGQSVTAAAHLARMRGRAGNKVPSTYGETHKALLQIAQSANTNYSILARSQARRHWVYSGHYPGTFDAPKNAQNAETKHQSGTYQSRY
jgi:hypothetical protein